MGLYGKRLGKEKRTKGMNHDRYSDTKDSLLKYVRCLSKIQ